MPRKGAKLSAEHLAKLQAGRRAWLMGGGTYTRRNSPFTLTRFRGGKYGTRRKGVTQKGRDFNEKARIAMRYAWASARSAGRQRLARGDLAAGWAYARANYTRGALGFTMKRRGSRKTGFSVPIPSTAVRLAPRRGVGSSPLLLPSPPAPLVLPVASSTADVEMTSVLEPSRVMRRGPGGRAVFSVQPSRSNAPTPYPDLLV